MKRELENTFGREGARYLVASLVIAALACVIGACSGCGGGGGSNGGYSGPTTCTAPTCQKNVPCYDPCDGKTYLNGVPQN